jgi:hypothetical protein
MALRWTITWLLLLICVACSACSSGDPQPEPTQVPINIAAIPSFLPLSEFPGSISGFDTTYGLITLIANEVCFDLDADIGLQIPDNVPLQVSIGVDDISESEFFVKVDDETGEVVYCFNPILGNGVYTLNIELMRGETTEIFSFEFQSDRPDPLRLREFPGEIIGLTRLTDNEISVLIAETEVRPVPIFRLSDEQLCVVVPNEIVVDAGARGMIDVALNGRLLTEQQILTEVMTDEYHFCFDPPETPGIYDLYLQLILVPGVPPRRVAYQGAFIVDEST